MYAFKNPMKFKKRIMGLTSYFRSAQEELLPRYDKQENFNIVRVPMSDFQFAQYERERHDEREQERKQKGKKGAVNNPQVATKEMEKESSSTFKIYSRLICNFATPMGFVRPKPARKKKAEDAAGVPGNVEEMMQQDLDYEVALQEDIQRNKSIINNSKSNGNSNGFENELVANIFFTSISLEYLLNSSIAKFTIGR